MQIRRFITKISNVETIARGRGIRDLVRLRSEYGGQSRNWLKRKGTADVELMNGKLVYAEVHWYECHGISRVEERVKIVLKILGTNMEQYVMCIERGDFRVSLTVHKVYKRLPDEMGEKAGMIRIIDDSEEDYLYSAEWFVPVELDKAGQESLDRVPA